MLMWNWISHACIAWPACTRSLYVYTKISMVLAPEACALLLGYNSCPWWPILNSFVRSITRTYQQTLPPPSFKKCLQKKLLTKVLFYLRKKGKNRVGTSSKNFELTLLYSEPVFELGRFTSMRNFLTRGLEALNFTAGDILIEMKIYRKKCSDKKLGRLVKLS